jgi:hypothetical protein
MITPTAPIRTTRKEDKVLIRLILRGRRKRTRRRRGMPLIRNPLLKLKRPATVRRSLLLRKRHTAVISSFQVPIFNSLRKVTVPLLFSIVVSLRHG